MKNFFIFICTLCLSFFINAKICNPIESNNFEGQFIDNSRFFGEYTYCRFDEPDEDNISQITIKLNIDGNINRYIYTGGPHPVLDVSDLGIISIYDKFGGMQSPAKITYLSSQNKQLIKLGEIDLIYNLGQVYDYSTQDVNNKIDYFNSIILNKKQDNFINNAPLSYTDAFLLLLSDDVLKNNTDAVWIQKFYAKLETLSYQDIINIYSQNIFFKHKTLCKKVKNEKDIFGCKIKSNQLSICYNSDSQSLSYRFGKLLNINLELIKEITDEEKDSKILTFTNTNTDYIVNTQQGQESIQIKQNGKVIGDLKCEPDSIEPRILDGLH